MKNNFLWEVFLCKVLLFLFRNPSFYDRIGTVHLKLKGGKNMNHYFYVPVMSQDIGFDGVSLREHLQVVDSELFEKERSISYLVSQANPSKMKERISLEVALNQEFEERQYPRYMILVLNEGRVYELASLKDVDSFLDNPAYINEITGEDVVNLFSKGEKYSELIHHFFDSYERRKDLPPLDRGVLFQKKKRDGNLPPRKTHQ